MAMKKDKKQKSKDKSKKRPVEMAPYSAPGIPGDPPSEQMAFPTVEPIGRPPSLAAKREIRLELLNELLAYCSLHGRVITVSDLEGMVAAENGELV